MPFIKKKVLVHGTTNPIVSRLSLQILQIMDQCNITQDMRDKIGKLYMESLQKKLLRCWEIRERFQQDFTAAVANYKPPSRNDHSIEIPQIARLEEECHDFLYNTKNYIRDLLKIFNILYGTEFKEASEYSRPKSGSQSLVEFAKAEFGDQDAKTQFLLEAVDGIEYLVNFRNAVEHPGGYSGDLHIKNFSLESDGKIAEPIWYRKKGGKTVDGFSPIREDIEKVIYNLLTLGEDILVSWAANNLKAPSVMRIRHIPAKSRNPQCPIKFIVTASPKSKKIAKKQGNKASKSFIKIEQTGSPIRRPHKQRATLIGLGLNKIGRVARVPDTPETRGMIAKVNHLVRVVNEPEAAIKGRRGAQKADVDAD